MALSTAPVYRKLSDSTVRFRAELNAAGTHYNIRRVDRSGRPDAKIRKRRFEQLYELETA